MRMHDIKWSVNGALNILLQSFSTTSIYHIGLQKLSIWSHLWPFSATLFLCMRRNGNLWTCSKISDVVIRFPPPISLQNAKFRWFGDVFRWFFAFYRLNVCHISTSVCLTYWPRKYTTYINPHSDNSHQVWSSTAELKCSVWWCVTWPCDLTFDLLTLNSCYTWWVTCPLSNPATKFEDPSLILSWVISYNVFHWIPLTLRFFATAHAPYHVTCA